MKAWFLMCGCDLAFSDLIARVSVSISEQRRSPLAPVVGALWPEKVTGLVHVQTGLPGWIMSSPTKRTFRKDP